jgi:hypothetical protein
MPMSLDFNVPFSEGHGQWLVMRAIKIQIVSGLVDLPQTESFIVSTLY